MSGTPVEPTLASPNPIPHIAPPAVEGDTLERLFQALFYRLAVIYSRAIPKEVRRLGETAILVMVDVSFTVVVLTRSF